MQIPSNPPSQQLGSQFIKAGASLIEGQETSQTRAQASRESESRETLHFQGNYIGQMEMYADAAQVAAYLDAHQEWLHRCAQTIAEKPIGENG